MATPILLSDQLEDSGWIHANSRYNISLVIKAVVIGHCIDMVMEEERGEEACMRDDFGR